MAVKSGRTWAINLKYVNSSYTGNSKMGLDTYVSAHDPEDLPKEVNWADPISVADCVENNYDLLYDTFFSFDADQFYYWRKFYQICQWSCDIWYERCSDITPDPNCAVIQITQEDIDNLKRDILLGVFGSGDSDVNDSHISDLPNFINKTQEKLDNGKLVFIYNSW